MKDQERSGKELRYCKTSDELIYPVNRRDLIPDDRVTHMSRRPFTGEA